MTNKYLISALFLILQYSAGAQTNVPAGNVSGNWALSGSPYLIQGNILIPDGSELSIEPGVVVEFQGKYKLFCNGQLLAIGNDLQPVQFTVPPGNAATGWLGIRFEDTPSTNYPSLLKYCVIENVRADATGNNIGGGLYFKNYSSCTIENCNFTNNYALNGGGAIYCQNSSPLIRNSTFTGNTTYQGGDCAQFLNSESIIEGNTFVGGGIYGINSSLVIRDNHISQSVEGAVSSFSTTPLSLVPFLEITNNVFENNTNENGAGGGAILLFDSSAKIEHNIIRNNMVNNCGGAITLWRNLNAPAMTDGIVSNNLIYGNASGLAAGGAGTGGGAIFCSNQSPKIINNTICGNSSPNFGGAVACTGNADPLFYNNILYNNTVNAVSQNIFLNDNDSDPSFINNDIQGGQANINTNGNPYTGNYSGNIDLLPAFTDASANDYSLAQGSPCINAGLADLTGLNVPLNDIAGNTRIANSVIDQGAYEFQGPLGIHDAGGLVKTASFYPNPAKDFITFDRETSSIAVYDMTGRLVGDFVMEGRMLNVSGLKPGDYLLKIKGENGTSHAKLIKR